MEGGWAAAQVSRCASQGMQVCQNGTVGWVFRLKWRALLAHNAQIATMPPWRRRRWRTHPAH